VFFETNESLTGDDTDTFQDVYRRAAGATIRYSLWNASHPGNGPFDAYYEANSDNGEYALYSTEEALATNDCDTDAQFDVYQRGSTVGTSSLRSFGPCGGGPFDAHFVGTADLGRVWFETEEQMLASDTDNSRDVYQSNGAGSVHLISTGPGGGNDSFDAQFAGAAETGSLVYFETDEPLTANDTDDRTDVYANDGGASFPPQPTQLMSTGPAGGNGAFDARFEGSSDDGLRTFFSTEESLVAQDTDANADVYEREPPVTTKLSTGPNGGNGAFDAEFAGGSREGDTVFFTTSESLVSGDTDASSDIYSRRDTAGYVRPAGATPIRLSLVPSYGECTSPNRTHGSPLAFGSCNPPQRSTPTTTVGTPEVNGAQVASVGSLKLRVIPAGPSPFDESDVRVDISITDVRRTSNNADYAGEVAAFAALRLTDRGSGPSGSEPATVTDFHQRLISVFCGATPSSAGATCAGFTTMNAVLPGSVVKGRRSVWQVGPARIEDGGSDGDVDTGPNATFARQGIFVP
jgi:hypothetical protein